MDLVRRLLLGDLVAETLEIILARDVGGMRSDARTLPRAFGLAQSLGLAHRLCRDVAYRDVAAFCHELTRQFAAHSRAASSDDGDLSGEILHGRESSLLSVPGHHKHKGFYGDGHGACGSQPR